MGREPFMRRSGPDYMQAGELIKPYAMVHPCCVDGCTKDGGWGFGTDLMRAKPVPGRWYCFEHRHIGEADFMATKDRA